MQPRRLVSILIKSSRISLLRFSFRKWDSHLAHAKCCREDERFAAEKLSSYHIKNVENCALRRHFSMLRSCLRHWILAVHMVRRNRRFNKCSLLRCTRAAFQLWCHQHQFMRWLHSVMVSFFHRVVAMRTIFRAFSCWTTRISGQRLLRSVVSLRHGLIQKSSKFLHKLWHGSFSRFLKFCFTSWSGFLKRRQRLERHFSLLEQCSEQSSVSMFFVAWRHQAQAQKLSSELQARNASLSQVKVNSQVHKKCPRVPCAQSTHILPQNEKSAFEARMRTLDAEVETLRTALKFQSQLLLPPPNAHRARRL